MAVRGFYLARLMKDGSPVTVESENGEGFAIAYPEAQLPEYQTAKSAGADFFCAEEVVVPSIWRAVFRDGR